MEKEKKAAFSPSHKEGDLGIFLIYRGITLQLQKFLLPYLSTVSNLKSRKFFGKNGLGRYRWTDSDYPLNDRRSTWKNIEATRLFVDFSKAFDSIHQGKMDLIILEYSVPKETVRTKLMLYKKTKAIVRSQDGDTDFFGLSLEFYKEINWRHIC